MRINCTSPAHTDDVPSMAIYEDGGFCHACGYLDRSIANTDAPKREQENIGDKLEYIRSLPRKEIRGLQLPYDSSGYFIVWPDNSYYKKRLWDGPSRYMGPAGHKPSLLRFSGLGSSLVIVEGELNAMSLRFNYKSNIVSPGSATNIMNYLQDYLLYGPNIAIVVDRDPIGVVMGLELKRELQKRGKRVSLIAVKQDLNDVLQHEGIEGIKKWQKENLEM